MFYKQLKKVVTYYHKSFLFAMLETRRNGQKPFSKM